MARREVGDVLLEVQDLNVDYLTLNGAVRAVSDASFTLHRGEILGLAGESGSGKSTLTTALLRLQRDPAVTAGGKVLFHEDDGSVVDLVPRTDRAAAPEMGQARDRDAVRDGRAEPRQAAQAQFVDVLRQH